MGLGSKYIKKLGIKLPPKLEWMGSAGFALVLLGIGLLALFLFMWAIGSSAKAHEENGWLTSDYAYLYLDEAKDLRTSFCLNDKRYLTSNLGVDVTIYKYNNIEWHGHIAHHSCAFGPDAPDYNAAGMGLVIKFERHGWFWQDK